MSTAARRKDVRRWTGECVGRPRAASVDDTEPQQPTEGGYEALRGAGCDSVRQRRDEYVSPPRLKYAALPSRVPQMSA